MSRVETRGTQGSVSVIEVAKEFHTKDGPIAALGPITLQIEPGEFISIIGPSGCGKSTLLSIVAGLTDSTRGRVEIAGVPVRRPHPDMSMMFQTDLLMDWMNIRENILIQARMRGRIDGRVQQRANELLRIAGLEGFAGRRPWELSGGMRQRAALCRTLVSDPKIILMDEPFGALDALTRARMGEFLEAISARLNSTVLFVTHSIEEAIVLSDRVIVMSHRPGTIADIIPIDLPRPRAKGDRSNPHFGELFTRIAGHFSEAPETDNEEGSTIDAR